MWRTFDTDSAREPVSVVRTENRGMIMNDKTWEKLAVLGGVAFVVLNIAGSILQGAPPASGDTNEEVLDWFADNDSGIKVSVFLAALSIIGLIWWFGSLWRRMSAAEDGNHRLSVVALIGLGGSGAMFGVHAAILAAVAINVDDVSADAAKFFLVMSSTVLSMGVPSTCLKRYFISQICSAIGAAKRVMNRSICKRKKKI